MTNQSQFRLTIGGDVQANNGTYLRRDVDDALLTACLNGDFAYVLACRQIGKSSLKNAVAEELIERGVQVARVDLNRIGQNVNAQQWYYSLLSEIARELGLRSEFEPWWESQPELSTHAQRFLTFFDQLVLPNSSAQKSSVPHSKEQEWDRTFLEGDSDAPVVIFLDEIDVTLGLPYTDDLFAAIRSVYNDRSQNDAYRRLSFVLLGVATPDDLINDSTRTPFNVGQPIPIQDFGYDEIASTFIALIEAQHEGHGQTYFDQIFAWTNGHPYLTQRLIQAVIASNDSPPNLVDQQVRDIFLTEGERLESNLHTVQTRVLSDEHVVGMMRIHRRLLDGKKVADAQKSPAINRLKLYGLVTAESGLLRIRNRIYEQVFDHEWNRKHFPINWSRRIAVAAVTLLVLIVLATAGILAHDNLWLPRVASQLNYDFSAAQQEGNPHEQCVALAELYKLDERNFGFGSSDYALQADQYLARLNADETIALFDPPADYCHAPLIEQFYMELVDTDLLASSQATGNDRLLQAMAASQVLAAETNATPVANVELAAWASARIAVRADRYEDSINAYSTAIAVDEANPGLFYERAFIFLELQDLDNALKDISQVDQLIDFATSTSTPASPTDTSTSTPTATVVPMVTEDFSLNGNQINDAPTSSVRATSQEMSEISQVDDSSETRVLGVDSSETRVLGVIERRKEAQLIAEVRRLIQEHPLFDNLTIEQVQDYGNPLQKDLELRLISPNSAQIAFLLVMSSRTSFKQPTENAIRRLLTGSVGGISPERIGEIAFFAPDANGSLGRLAGWSPDNNNTFSRFTTISLQGPPTNQVNVPQLVLDTIIQFDQSPTRRKTLYVFSDGNGPTDAELVRNIRTNAQSSLTIHTILLNTAAGGNATALRNIATAGHGMQYELNYRDSPEALDSIWVSSLSDTIPLTDSASEVVTTPDKSTAQPTQTLTTQTIDEAEETITLIDEVSTKAAATTVLSLAVEDTVTIAPPTTVVADTSTPVTIPSRTPTFRPPTRVSFIPTPTFTPPSQQPAVLRPDGPVMQLAALSLALTSPQPGEKLPGESDITFSWQATTTFASGDQLEIVICKQSTNNNSRTGECTNSEQLGANGKSLGSFPSLNSITMKPFIIMDGPGWDRNIIRTGETYYWGVRLIRLGQPQRLISEARPIILD